MGPMHGRHVVLLSVCLAAAALAFPDVRSPIRTGDAVRKAVAVIGERHSGTNFMRRLLEENLDLSALMVTNAFCANKHKYQAPNKQCLPPETTAVIVMLRNPYDWAAAMHRACWCEADQAKSTPFLGADAPFEAFLTQPWMDNSIKPWTRETQRAPCAHILECRRFKLINFLNISSWAPFVEYVRHEDVVVPEDSLRWLAGFVERHGLTTTASKGKLKANVHYKGKFADKFDSEDYMGGSLWFNHSLAESNSSLRDAIQLVSRYMDSAVESMAGYPAIFLKPLPKTRGGRRLGQNP
ncbi:hypothetical protein FOA52_002623 [Chlamydomonas sp. UWO 241]|nr:hypothetical protein FOA52_002623 [Chlamydomonas sp. UWO 241]